MGASAASPHSQEVEAAANQPAEAEMEEADVFFFSRMKYVKEPKGDQEGWRFFEVKYGIYGHVSIR